jgi:predicted DNA binding CopG/RHH family protein
MVTRKVGGILVARGGEVKSTFQERSSLDRGLSLRRRMRHDADDTRHTLRYHGAARIDMKKLDQEEKELLAEHERDEFKSVASEEVLRRYRKYARATLTKNKRVNIRLSTLDLADIQARAAEEGLPYQTLMASVLHKFATGRLVERKSKLASRSRRSARNRNAA